MASRSTRTLVEAGAEYADVWRPRERRRKSWILVAVEETAVMLPALLGCFLPASRSLRTSVEHRVGAFGT